MAGARPRGQAGQESVGRLSDGGFFREYTVSDYSRTGCGVGGAAIFS